MSSSRLVILGAGGFVGRAIAAQATNVRSVSSREIDLTTPGAGEKLGGILSSDDIVVYASAITPDKGKDVGAFLRNCEMARQVALAIGKTKVRRVVYLSSDAVFAEDFPEITEATLPCPNSLYGTMHLAREQIMEQACTAAGIPLLIVRLCAIYGPGDTHNSYGPNRFVRMAQTGGPIKLFGQGEEMRPHAHVDDVASIVCSLIALEATGIVHAIPSPSLSFHAVASIVASLAQGVEVECAPRSGQPNHKHFHSKRLEELLPSFRFRDLRDGLAEQREECR